MNYEHLEGLALAAKAARDAYMADDDGPEALELSINADEALEALDRVAQPYQDTILALIAENRAYQMHLTGMCDAYELLCQQSGMNYHESPSSKYAAARAALNPVQQGGQNHE